MINGSSIDYQWYSTVIILCSKFAYFHRVGGWVGGWVGGGVGGWVGGGWVVGT